MIALLQYAVGHTRADGSARSGLGLAIAKAIVEIHGGVISIESEVGEGSVFRVRLPKPDYAA